MRAKQKKELQKDLVKKNIDYYFYLIDNNFFPNYSREYVREILKFSTSFKVRLTREQKLKFCKNCLIPFNINTRKIVIDKNSKTKIYICRNCNFKRRFPYK